MRENKKRFLLRIEEIARNRVEQEVNKWPPLCRGVLHQPKRPKTIVRQKRD